ncbi:MAG: hypothetical protein IK079_03870, partial [Desulfovibrio sp.]|nr:hypothetical protein [Desulfovibrio sp.]
RTETGDKCFKGIRRKIFHDGYSSIEDGHNFAPSSIRRWLCLTLGRESFLFFWSRASAYLF